MAKVIAERNYLFTHELLHYTFSEKFDGFCVFRTLIISCAVVLIIYFNANCGLHKPDNLKIGSYAPVKK